MSWETGLITAEMNMLKDLGSGVPLSHHQIQGDVDPAVPSRGMSLLVSWGLSYLSWDEGVWEPEGPVNPETRENWNEMAKNKAIFVQNLAPSYFSILWTLERV